MWYFFIKVGYNDLVSWDVTWSGKMHALMALQSSGAYENEDMGLTSITKYMYVVFFMKLGE